MHFAVISLFPDMINGLAEYGVIGKAIRSGMITCEAIDPRSFTSDVHKTVDDRPFGGGPGMVMMAKPLRLAITKAKQEHEKAKVIYLSPQGRPLRHKKVVSLASDPALILIAGRYEGIDQRVIDHDVDEEISIGDFVVSGGELPAMMLIDAVSRLKPGVLGHAQSVEYESFTGDLLDHPHYTRPKHDETGSVPDVLLSGNHAAIEAWRRQQREVCTQVKRPDLWAKYLKGHEGDFE